ncbi:C2H2-type Zn-finger protein [Ceraceosorus bombacis]|uniref:C2H2-type Zn-finger protein n=1 Tax=Ceraceosorus bombacis TaxID=401625 RepID=A0A0P1BT07_9BASI|nr:C2H2-type Zn-finger protein [Ceraceosorus bombacis]
MKRRVAGLPHVRPDVFREKVEEINAAGAEPVKEAGKCQACAKSFSTANAFRTHVNSRKHKENEALLARARSGSSKVTPSILHSTAAESESAAEPAAAPGDVALAGEGLEDVSDLQEALAAASTNAAASAAILNGTLEVPADATEAEIEAAIDLRIASSKRVDPSKACMFCLKAGFRSLDDTLEHLRSHHSFFVPDQEYLTDLAGLMVYLADKVSVGHLCLFCNGRGRGFNSAEAARSHMLDKGHCKIAYDSDEDMLELSDFYDFSSSYPEAEWEDVEGTVDGGSDEEEDVDTETETDDATDAGTVATTSSKRVRPDAQGVRFGDNEMELVLPSGARLGHRALRHVYDQRLRPAGRDVDSATHGSALAHRLANRAIAARKTEQQDASGLSLAQRGGNVVKAKDRGQAKEAKRHIKEFRDVQRREQFKTRVGFRANNQAHFRDPLLQ